MGNNGSNRSAGSRSIKHLAESKNIGCTEKSIFEISLSNLIKEIGSLQSYKGNSSLEPVENLVWNS